MRLDSILFAGACLASLFLGTAAQAENWPQWRGPNSDGISTETGIATTWSKTNNVAWRLPLPGPAGATPVIWEDRIFLTSSKGDDLYVMCATTGGENVWMHKVGSGNKDARSGEGNSASASPSTDGKHVWAFFGTGVLVCFDVDGNEIWKFNVQDRYGKFDIQFGMTSTPVLDDGALYLQLIHGTMRGDYTVGKIIKLDAATGEEIWAVDRPSGAKFECKHSYASPFMYDDGERKFLVTHGGDCTAGTDPETGAELWRVGGLNGPSSYNENDYDPTFRFVASPGMVPGAIVIPTAKRGPTVALKVDDTLVGDSTGKSSVVRWVNEKTPDVCLPTIVDGIVYLCRKDGRLIAVDLETGEELYYVRTHTAQHRSSPLYADGNLYLCARDGHCTVVKAGREFEVVAENELGEPITASPVVSNGTLYLRTYEALYAIRE